MKKTMVYYFDEYNIIMVIFWSQSVLYLSFLKYNPLQ